MTSHLLLGGGLIAALTAILAHDCGPGGTGIGGCTINPATGVCITTIQQQPPPGQWGKPLPGQTQQQCQGMVDGVYCGTSTQGGFGGGNPSPGTLYRCKAGQVTEMRDCGEAGCIVAAKGVDDQCVCDGWNSDPTDLESVCQDDPGTDC